MFKHIVVPLDGSPLAGTTLVPACALARRFHAELLLMSARALPEVAEMGTYLAGQADRLSAEGLAVRVVLPPSLAEGMSGELTFVPPALIVMTIPRYTGVDALLHPCVTWDLFTQTAVTMLVRPCGENTHTPPQGQVPRFLTDQTVPILVPLDGSLLAEQALPLAQELAQACGNPLVLVRAVEPVLVGSAWERAATEWALVEAESYLKRKQAELMGTGMRIDIKSGLDLAPAFILEGVQQERAGLIVMGSHGRGWWGRLVLGSVARSVLRQVEVPVLLVPGVTSQEEPKPIPRVVETSLR